MHHAKHEAKTQDNKKTGGVDVEDERFYSIEDIAKILNVSDGAVRKWLKAGALKGIKLGRIWRIREGDLDRFLRERENPTGENRKRL